MSSLPSLPSLVKHKSKSFRLFDFHVYDEKSQEKGSYAQFVVQMFGINELGETCSICVNDFNPFFYVSVPASWKKEEADNLLIELKKKVGSGIIGIELKQYNKLYGFNAGGKEQFACITFANMAIKNRVSYLWYVEDPRTSKKKLQPYLFGKDKLELYESFIPPLLRYFHIQHLSPSGWVMATVSKMKTPDVKTTTCKYEYIASKRDIEPQPDKETLVPYKICSFDIEANSSHGDFPLPIKTYKRLASNIVDVFLKHNVVVKKQGEQLFKKTIQTAFGMAKFDDIDAVYPKYEPTSDEVLEMVETALQIPMKTFKPNKKVIRSLTIDSLFTCQRSNGGETGDTDEEEEEPTEEEESMEEVDEPMEEEEITKKVTEPTVTKKKVTTEPKKVTTKPTVMPVFSIVDILIDPETTREEKIQKTNDCLTDVLPELEGDQVTFIGSTFVKYGEPEPYLNHCLTLGSCAPVEGAVIESVATENELLVQWTQLIQTENPDIVIGYNIFGFDYEFLFRRAMENGCENEFLKMSRNIGHMSANWDKDIEEYKLDNTQISLASGEYNLHYPKMIGRFQIDVLVYFRKEFNLPSYKLDDVSGQFIGDTISKIDYAEGETILWCKNTTGLNRNDYIHIELSEFTNDPFMGGKKFKVLEIRTIEVEECKKGQTTLVKYKHIVIEPICEHIDFSLKTVKWGLAKDDVSVQDIFRLTRGTAEDRAVVAKYCIQDCNIVHHLMRKIDILVGFIEMSRICSVPMSFLVLRGQGIKLTSFVAKQCRERDTLIPTLEKVESNDGYEGAIVLPPKCSMYIDNPVACLDYASLYPSNMISQNLSHDSKVWVKEYNLEGVLIYDSHPRGNPYDNLPNYHYVDVEFDTYKYTYKKPGAKQAQKVKCGKRVCRWAQFPDNKKGIMPSILEELLKARKTTRKRAEQETDEFMKNILDKRQLAYKVTANSLYGQCGSKTSTFYEKDIAASTTAVGRMMIMYAKKMIEQVYGEARCETSQGPVITHAEYVYGDTDSVFFTFHLEDAMTRQKIRGKKALEITIELAQEVALLCSKFLISPMELSYEKTLMPFILLSKKRYVGMLYETDANKGKLKYMGLSLKRRDACDYLKDVYGGVLNILMQKGGGENRIKQAIDFLEHSLRSLIAGNVSMDKLEITKALRSDYKTPERIGHKVLADRIGERDPGNKPKSGDRIKYVFFRSPNPKALVGERIETPEFIVKQGLTIDYKYYITNQLMKPLQQLFGLALEDIWSFRGKDLAISKFRKEMNVLMKESNGDIEVFMKKKEKKTSAYVKTLLFDAFLTEIHNRENKIQTIDTLFSKKIVKSTV